MNKFTFDKRHMIIHNKREIVTAKMPDNSVDIVIEDPPFGVRDEDWDNKEHYISKVGEWLQTGLRISKHGVVWFCASRMMPYIFEQIDNEMLKRVHIWEKPEGSQYAGASNNNIWFSIEPILVFSKHWDITKRYGKSMPFAYDVFKYRTTPHKVFGHPTSKPLALMRKLIGHYSAEDELIFDGFGGSFSTAVACVDMGRRSMTVEQLPSLDKPITDYKGDNPDYFYNGKVRLENKINEPRMFVGEEKIEKLETINLFKEK